MKGCYAGVLRRLRVVYFNNGEAESGWMRLLVGLTTPTRWHLYGESVWIEEDKTLKTRLWAAEDKACVVVEKNHLNEHR
jgi:hypothetical protein